MEPVHPAREKREYLKPAQKPGNDCTRRGTASYAAARGLMHTRREGLAIWPRVGQQAAINKMGDHMDMDAAGRRELALFAACLPRQVFPRAKPARAGIWSARKRANTS